MLAQKSNSAVIGRAPEDLSIAEKLELAGKWIALELYTPTALKEEQGAPVIDLKLRRIRAIGDSAQDCIRQLRQAGLDPKDFQFTQLTRAF